MILTTFALHSQLGWKTSGGARRKGFFSNEMLLIYKYTHMEMDNNTRSFIRCLFLSFILGNVRKSEQYVRTHVPFCSQAFIFFVSLFIDHFCLCNLVSGRKEIKKTLANSTFNRSDNPLLSEVCRCS